jgi:hypothetical protein
VSDDDRKYRSSPRLSAAKLAEYAASSSSRKRGAILKDQAFPPVVKRAFYSPARDSLAQFMVAGGVSLEQVSAAQDRFATYRRGTSWTEQRIRCCTEALMHALAAPELYRIQPGSWRRSSASAVPLKIGEVQVSVHPDLVRIDPKTGAMTGAVMFVCSKDHVTSIEEAAYLTTLLRRWLLLQNKNAKISPKNLIVIDVFHRTRFAGTTRFRKLLRELVRACDDIPRLWPQAPGAEQVA